MYANLGAAATTTTPSLTAAQQSTLAAGIAALPSCYDQKFHDCWWDERLDAFPNCATIQAAWALDKPRLEEMVHSLPICPCPKCTTVEKSSALASPVLTYALGGLSLLLAGLLVYQSRK